MLPTQRPFEGVTFYDPLTYPAGLLGGQGGWTDPSTGKARTTGHYVLSPNSADESDAEHVVPIDWSLPFHVRLQLRIPAGGPSDAAFLFIGLGGGVAGLELDWSAGSWAAHYANHTFLYDRTGNTHHVQEDNVEITRGIWHDLEVFFDGIDANWKLDGYPVAALAAADFSTLAQVIRISTQVNNAGQSLEVRNLIITNP